jgi:hypothetical protein
MHATHYLVHVLGEGFEQDFPIFPVIMNRIKDQNAKCKEQRAKSKAQSAKRKAQSAKSKEQRAKRKV